MCYYARPRQFGSEIVLIGRSRDYLCIIISKFDAPFDTFPLSLWWFDIKSHLLQQLASGKNRYKYRRVRCNYWRKFTVPEELAPAQLPAVSTRCLPSTSPPSWSRVTYRSSSSSKSPQALSQTTTAC